MVTRRDVMGYFAKRHISNGCMLETCKENPSPISLLVEKT